MKTCDLTLSPPSYTDLIMCKGCGVEEIEPGGGIQPLSEPYAF